MKIYQCWVKKLVDKKEWNSHYSKLSSYCMLGKDFDKIWVGFVIGDPNPDYMPDNCFALTTDELRQVDEYRRPRNIAPLPLEGIKVEKREISKETLSTLDKIKAKFIKMVSVE